MAVVYPYLPEGRTILYVAADNPFMRAARDWAKEHSLDHTMPTGTVFVRDGVILAQGANGSMYHETNGCERVRLGIPTGQRYDLCEGCHPKNHSEQQAVLDALARNQDTQGAELYLWGHWWMCESCWDAVIAAGVGSVYLMEGSERLFNKNHPDHIVGRQFEMI